MTDIQATADALLAARDGGAACRLPAATPLSQDEAYAIQRRVALALDPQPCHWKTGLLADGSVFCAPVPASDVFRTPADLRGRHFRALHVEAELAYRFGREFAPGRAYGRDEVLEAVDAVAVAIEVLDSRLADWESAPGLHHLADAQMNGALILGTGRAEWRGIDYPAQPMRLSINGELRAEARGGHPQGDPTSLLAGFVNRCLSVGYALPAGVWVTTGTWSGFPAARAGDDVEVVFPGIGEARARF